MRVTRETVLKPTKVAGAQFEKQMLPIVAQTAAGRTATGRLVKLFQIDSNREDNRMIQRVPILNEAERLLLEQRGVDRQVIARTQMLSALAVQVCRVPDGMRMFKHGRDRVPRDIDQDSLMACADEAASMTNAIQSNPNRLYVGLVLHRDNPPRESNKVVRLHGIGIHRQTEQHPWPTPYLLVANKLNGMYASPHDLLRAPLYEEVPNPTIDI